jgi:hypothetical protein
MVRAYLVGGLTLLLAMLSIGAVPAGALPGCTDEFTNKEKNEEFRYPGNWTAGLPTSTSVVCWAADLTPVIRFEQDWEVARIESGGGLTVGLEGVNEGGGLYLREAESVSHLSGPVSVIGDLDGPGSLDLTGSFDWAFGDIAYHETIAINQTGGGAFVVGDNGDTYIYGGSLTTTSPIEIKSAEFSAAPEHGHPTITTTSDLVLPAGKDLGAGAESATFITAGVAENPGPEYGVGSAKLILTGGSTHIAPATKLVSGEVTVAGGTLQDDGSLQAPATDVTGGVLSGLGTVAGPLVEEGGTIAPGDGASGRGGLAASSFEGRSGSLRIGIASGSSFDSLAVSGAATLGGSVDAEDEGGFKPAAGEEFKFLTAASTAGTFASTTGSSGDLYTLAYPLNGASLLAKAPPSNVTPPVISGVAAPGEALQCSTGTWTGNPTTFEYQWKLEGVPIPGATGSTFVVQTADEGGSLTCTVVASYGPSSERTSPAISVPRTPLALSCGHLKIVLISVLESGHSVQLSGYALARYAGKKVTITISDVPKRYAKGKGGSTVVQPNGSFSAKLVLPKGKLAPLTRYTATVDGQSSLGLKLGRNLIITAQAPVHGGSRVSFRFVGPRGPGKGVVQFTRQESCTSNKIVATAKLTKANTLTVTLPAPAKAGETSYYRAQTRIAAGVTYSLPIAVTNG